MATMNVKLLRTLNRNIQRLALRLEAANLQDYIDLTHRPFRMMWINFLSGLARGIGMFIGAGAMGAVALALFTVITVWALHFLNMLPVVGDLSNAIGDVIRDFLSAHKK